MTTGTKVFRIIISVLLALCILCCAFFFFAVYYFDQMVIYPSDYEIYVAGVAVTGANKDDILGDGTVYYDPNGNLLVFSNAQITTDQPALVTFNDLGIYLEGENKFTSTCEDYTTFISAADYYNPKDLYIYGDGSLTVEYLNSCQNSAVLQCDDLTLLSDLTITTPKCTNLSNGLVCDSSLKLLNGATITVNGSSAQSLAAFRVRGNALLEANTAININVENGSTDAAKAIYINGDFVLNEGAAVTVNVAEDTAKTVECVRVNGLLEVGAGASLTASTAKSYAIECGGAIKLCDGAIVSAKSADSDTDIFCYGAIADFGATITGNYLALAQCYQDAN